MNAEDDLFFGALVTASVWVVLCLLLATRIKNRHPSIYKSCGYPTFTRIPPDVFACGASLLLTGSHKHSNDIALTALVYALRSVGAVLLVLFVLFTRALFQG